MSLTDIMAAVGFVVQATLAVLLLYVWRALRVRWAALVAAGFAAQAAEYLNVAFGHYVRGGDWQSAPGTLNMLLALAAQGLVTSGLLAYVGLPGPAARRCLGATWLAVGGMAVRLLAGGMTRVHAVAFVAFVVLCWAALFAWAMRREPRRCHGIVMLAVLSYPVAMVSALAGWLSVTGAGVSLIAPDAVLGMTLLMTGLVRAHGQSVLALQAREAARAELERANQTLEMRVNQRTAQLRETIEGLESFNRAVSHDLRGPLGGITGIATLARDALARGDAAEADRLPAAIVRQSASSSELLASLMELARSTGVQVERRPVDTSALVREVVSQADAAGVVHVDEPLPALEGDPVLVRQVFANLLANGLKFSGRAQQPRVDVGATRTADGTVFHVRDNGVGFPPARAGELFIPFHRLHADRFEGHGIGLTIVRRIVERHGGRVWAEGRPGQGATFYFTLEPASA